MTQSNGTSRLVVLVGHRRTSNKLQKTSVSCSLFLCCHITDVTLHFLSPFGSAQASLSLPVCFFPGTSGEVACRSKVAKPPVLRRCGNTFPVLVSDSERATCERMSGLSLIVRGRLVEVTLLGFVFSSRLQLAVALALAVSACSEVLPSTALLDFLSSVRVAESVGWTSRLPDSESPGISASRLVSVLIPARSLML